MDVMNVDMVFNKEVMLFVVLYKENDVVWGLVRMGGLILMGLVVWMLGIGRILSLGEVVENFVFLLVDFDNLFRCFYEVNFFIYLVGEVVWFY